MRRRLLNLLTAVSLLLCTAAAGGVAYSYWAAHNFNWGRRAVAGNSVRETRSAVYVGWGAARVAHSRSESVYTSRQPVEDLLRRQGSALRSVYHHGSSRASAPREGFGSVWERLGFYWRRTSINYPPGELPDGRGTVSQSLYEIEVAAPVWPLGLFGVLPPAFWSLRLGRRWRSHRNTRRGLCPSCGYDLRGTPDRCPECGAPAPVPAT